MIKEHHEHSINKRPIHFWTYKFSSCHLFLLKYAYMYSFTTIHHSCINVFNSTSMHPRFLTSQFLSVHKSIYLYDISYSELLSIIIKKYIWISNHSLLYLDMKKSAVEVQFKFNAVQFISNLHEALQTVQIVPLWIWSNVGKMIHKIVSCLQEKL